MNWKFWQRKPNAKIDSLNGIIKRQRDYINDLLANRRPQTQVAGLPSEEARAAAYLQAPDNGLFLAVLADLREFAVEVSDRALDADLSDAKLRWHTGGSDALLEFLEKLQQRERDARLTAEQLAAKQAEEKGVES